MSDLDNKFLASNYGFSREFDCDMVKLLPGEFYISSQDIVISTILGSCVAACLRDPIAKIGGMNHFMLPDNVRDNGVVSRSMRYGANAMEILINELLKLGAHRDRLEAKVFGGGAVLKNMAANVGVRNTMFVRQYLQKENIPIVAEDMDGVIARKLMYFPATGRILMAVIPDIVEDGLVSREEKYAKELRIKDVSGEIELFNSSSHIGQDNKPSKNEADK